MNWFAYLPPIISVYLVLTSGFSGRNLKRLVKDINTQSTAIEETKAVIEEVALDWGERLNFYNAMFIALISCFSVYSPKSSAWTVGTFLVLMFIFIPLFYWTNSQGAGDLVTTRTRHLNLLYTTIYRIVLLVVNCILLVEIFTVQNLV